MSQVRRRLYKYYDLVMALFVTILLCSNVIGAAKVCTLWGFTFGAGVLFFPISYIFNDVLTEVYGYARARKVVWAGFGAIIFASFMSWVIVSLPPAAGWNDQEAYKTVFGQTPRIVFASLTAFFVGEFANSYVLGANDRFNNRWRGCGFACLLSRRVFRRMGESFGPHSHGEQLHHQSFVGGGRHTGHISGCGIPQARRAGRLLRPGHELYAVFH